MMANPFRRHPLTRYEWAWDRVATGSGCHLDVGCDAGVLVAALHEGTSRAVVGVDVDRSLLLRLRDRLPDGHAVQVGPLDPLPFADATFTTATVLEVAEHVPDERALLAEVARVLAPGGRLLLSVPAAHAFSFLDPDNARLRWPVLYRLAWRIRRRDSARRPGTAGQRAGTAGQRAVAGPVGNGITERAEHTNFEPAAIAALIESVGLRLDREEGSGLFFRWLQIPALLLPGAAGRLAERLMVADAHLFAGPPGTGLTRRANLFVTAIKDHAQPARP
jgi:SAM-dependent methyltransferase